MKVLVLKLLHGLEERRFTVSGTTFAITCTRGSLDRGKDAGIDKDGRYEAVMSERFADCLKKLKPDGFLIDIGSGIGYYSILASLWFSPANIHAFEPEATSYSLLQLNNRKYCQGRIKLNRVYIGGEVTKNMVTLDKYCQDNWVVPNIIKMDIEGYEYYAVDGMLETLGNHHPVLLIEFHERLMRENLGISAKNAQETISKLEKLGYRIQYNGHHYFANTHDGVPQLEWTDHPSNNINYAMFCEARQ